MATTESSAPKAHPSTRRARTNAGKFLSLQAAYRAGRLDAQGEEQFEAIVLELARLYKTR